MRQFLTSSSLTVLVLLFITNSALAQLTGDYRSVNAPKSGAGGNWNDVTKWERFDGAAWIAAGAAPTFTDGVITIRANDSIVVSTSTPPVTADQIVVDAGGVLAVRAGGNNLTLNDGPGDDLTVNGTLLLRTNNTINGPGNIVVNGQFDWFSGTLAAPTVTSAASLTNFSIPGAVFDKNLNASLVNNGTVNWYTGGGTGIVNTNSTSFTNNGTINAIFSSDGGFGAAVGSFINNGTVNKTTTSVFSNNGAAVTNNGILRGIGTYNFGGVGLVNTGTVAPGNSPGILSSANALLFGQPAAVSIEVLNGTGAGTGHDRLDITGTVPLNLSTLTLNVTELAAAPLQAYTVLTIAGTTFTGTFGTVNVPPTSTYTIAYLPIGAPTSVVITKTASTLPAVWNDFSAISKGSNAVTLNWSTLQEINTAQFVIEYSKDGRQFSPITTVPAAGNSNFTKQYSFVHRLQEKGSSNFYRIKLEDTDGKTSYSFTRVVKFSKDAVVAVVATPNPVVSSLNLAVQETVEIRMTDLHGRTVKTLKLNPGNHSVDMSMVPVGVYQLIVLKNGELIDTQKIIKQ